MKFLEENELLTPGSKTLIAASAGLDSSVLCHLFEKAGLGFGIAHCNFLLRGEESNEDEVFARNMANEMGVPIYVKRFHTSLYANRNKLSIQEAARDLRYEWFSQVSAEHGYRRIATAHHLDDSVETMLFNLTKGCGIRGLHGILPAHGPLIRPLLFATRRELEKYAWENNVHYREDSSNMTEKYSRNIIRKKVIPVLEQINPAFHESAAATIGRLREVEHVYHLFFKNLKEVVMRQRGDKIFINKGKLDAAGLNGTILYELLRPFEFNKDQVPQIMQSLGNAPGTMFFSPTHRLLIDRENLIIKSSKEETNPVFYVSNTTTKVDLGDGKITFQLKNEPPDSFPNNENKAYLDYFKLQFPLVLRHWKDGDSFQPLGMDGHHQKLQDFFSTHKISRFDKDKVWILESAGQICWVAGMRPDERFKVTPMTRLCLEATFFPATFTDDNPNNEQGVV